jgi:DNA-binding MarR family transcriptional regulator
VLSRADHSQRELAAAAGVTEQTMSRILERMERTGYVTRSPHRDDRRRHVISLTPAGRSVVAEAADPAPAEAMTTRGLTPEQVTQLRMLLTLMVTGGSAEGHSPPAGQSESSTSSG